ncbi:MAG TPA: tetratricopeptide repeat protein [Brumimicrobium sp.]|nr:tetratricopeptide repeat protein [Brumimicrobium sp.]
MLKTNTLLIYLFILYFFFPSYSHTQTNEELIDSYISSYEELIFREAWDSLELDTKKLNLGSNPRDTSIVYCINQVLKANIENAKYIGEEKPVKLDRIYEECVQLAKKYDYPELKYWVTVNFAFYYYSLNDYNKAYPLFIETMNFIKKYPNKKQIQEANTYTKLGYFLGYLKEYEEAIYFLSHAKDLVEPNSKSEAVILDNLGVYHVEMGDLKSAKTCFDKALLIAKNEGLTLREAKIYGNQSDIYRSKGDYNTAITLLEADLAISEELKANKNSLFALLKLANIYLEKRDIPMTQSVIDRINEYKEIDFFYYKLFEYELYKVWVDVAREQGVNELELQVRRRYDDVYDSIKDLDSEELIQKINWMVLKERYEFQLENKNTKIEHISERNRLLYLILLLLTVIGILIYFYYIKKRRLEREHYNNIILQLKLDTFTIENKLEETNYTLENYLDEKNQQIKKLEKEIKKVRKNSSYNNENQINQLYELLNSHLMTEENWLKFKNEFIKRCPAYFDKLITLDPSFTENNIRYIILFRLGINSHDLSHLLGVSEDAIKKSKQRLKLKLGDDLEALLSYPLA